MSYFSRFLLLNFLGLILPMVVHAQIPASVISRGTLGITPFDLMADTCDAMDSSEPIPLHSEMDELDSLLNSTEAAMGNLYTDELRGAFLEYSRLSRISDLYRSLYSEEMVGVAVYPQLRRSKTLTARARRQYLRIATAGLPPGMQATLELDVGRRGHEMICIAPANDSSSYFVRTLFALGNVRLCSDMSESTWVPQWTYSPGQEEAIARALREHGLSDSEASSSATVLSDIQAFRTMENSLHSDEIHRSPEVRGLLAPYLLNTSLRPLRSPCAVARELRFRAPPEAAISALLKEPAPPETATSSGVDSTLTPDVAPRAGRADR